MDTVLFGIPVQLNERQISNAMHTMIKNLNG